MWIVNLALRRPYTFIVLAVFILIAGVLSIVSTPKDIFPSINIPAISAIWSYTGMAPKDMAGHFSRLTFRLRRTRLRFFVRCSPVKRLPALRFWERLAWHIRGARLLLYSCLLPRNTDCAVPAGANDMASGAAIQFPDQHWAVANGTLSAFGNAS